MKTIVKVIALALVTAMLLGPAAGPARADCPVGQSEWDGTGGDNLWSTQGNWVDDYPPTQNHLTGCLPYEDSGDNLCEYDTGADDEAWSITILGEDPTYFTFNITNDICPSSFDLQDYSYVDVDDCVDTGSSDLSDTIKINVDTGVECCLGDGDVEDESASIQLTGEVIFNLLDVDADNAPANVRLSVAGTGTLLANTLQIRPDLNSGHTARTGGFALSNATVTTNALNIHAGQSNDRRVNMDLNNSMTVRNKTTIARISQNDTVGGGRVHVDIDPGKVLDVGELYISGPCILKVTGTDTEVSKGQLQTSANESAAANTCSCSCS